MSDDEELRKRLAEVVPTEPEVLGYVRHHIAMRAHAIGLYLPTFTVTREDPDLVRIQFDGALSHGVVNVIGNWLYEDPERPPATYRYLVVGQDRKLENKTRAKVIGLADFKRRKERDASMMRADAWYVNRKTLDQIKAAIGRIEEGASFWTTEKPLIVNDMLPDGIHWR